MIQSNKLQMKKKNNPLLCIFIYRQNRTPARDNGSNITGLEIG